MLKKTENLGAILSIYRTILLENRVQCFLLFMIHHWSSPFEVFGYEFILFESKVAGSIRSNVHGFHKLNILIVLSLAVNWLVAFLDILCNDPLRISGILSSIYFLVWGQILIKIKTLGGILRGFNLDQSQIWTLSHKI